MPFQQISDAFGAALQETVADFRTRTQSRGPRRQGFPYLKEVWPLRAKLTADLEQCGTAAATLFSIDEDGVWHYGLSITVADPMDVMAGSLLAVEGEAGLYMPAGAVAFIKWMLDSQQYEVFAYGDASCENGSGSGSGSGWQRERRIRQRLGERQRIRRAAAGRGSGSGPGSGACELPPCPTDGCRYRLVCEGGCPTWSSRTAVGPARAQDRAPTRRAAPDRRQLATLDCVLSTGYWNGPPADLPSLHRAPAMLEESGFRL